MAQRTSPSGVAAEADHEGWGPTISGGPPRRRIGRRLGLSVLVLVMLLAAWGVAVGLHASNSIERVAVEGLDGGGSPMHVLVVGSDSRANLSAEERADLTTGSAEGERTDTIFVMTIRGGRVALLAFPRDLYVSRCDGSTGRINAAFGIGGPSCLAATVEELSGIELSHYLAIDFLGFRDLVDAVGGVDLCLDQPIADDDAGIDLPAGCQTLNGRDALGFVRVRKIDNDLERIKRQQRFLKALAEKLVAPTTLLVPFRLWETAGATGEAMTADEGLGPIDLARLGFGLRGLAGGSAVTHTVPAEPATIGGAAVLEVNEDEASQLFAAFEDGSILDTAATDVRPEDVSVIVLNGAGVEGLASETADALEARGYTVSDVGNAETTERTVVRYPAGQQAEAQLVAGELPGDPVVEEAAVETITIILGTDLGG